MFLKKSTNKSLTVLAAGLLFALTGSSPAFASDSPFDDYVKYNQLLNGTGDGSDLLPYMLPEYRAEFSKKSAEEKTTIRRQLAGAFGIKDVKLRSQAKAGNQAIVLIDCQGMATVGVGSKMGMQPLINVLHMTRYGDTWVVSRIDMKRPQEAAGAGITTAEAMLQDKQWCSGAHKITAPNKPLTGLLQGSSFTVRSAEMTPFNGSDSLAVHINDSAKFKNLTMYIVLAPKVNQNAVAINYTENGGVTQISFSGKIDGRDSTLFFHPNDGYAISLQRLPVKDGNLPFYMVLRLPDGKHTELKGYLYAKSI